MAKIDPRPDNLSPVPPELRMPAGAKPGAPARAEGRRPLDVMDRGRTSIFDAPRPASLHPPVPPVVSRPVEPPAAPVTRVETKGTAPVPALARLEVLRAAMPRHLDVPGALRPSLRAVQERLESVAGELTSTKAAVAASPRDQAARYTAGEAGRALDGIADLVGEARARLSALRGADARAREAVAGAHGSATAIVEQAGVAGAVLDELGPWMKTADVEGAALHVGALGRGARALAAELSLLGGRAGVVSAAAARGAALEAARVPPPTEAELSETLGLTEEDLASVGAAYAGGQAPPQMLWNAAMVEAVAAEAVRQGGLSAEQSAAHAQAARELLGVEGEGQGRLDLDPADLVAVLKAAGIDLRTVDPAQVVAAARHLNTAKTRSAQAETLGRVLDCFATLGRAGLPKLPRATLQAQLATVGVKNDATKKLKEQELQARFQEIARVANAGGEYQAKLGKYEVKLKFSGEGRLLSSKCKKPSFWSKLGKVFKSVVLPVALTVMSFIPVTAPFAIAANAAMGLGSAIKNKNPLGIVAAAASFVGAGAAVVAAKAAGTAATVAGKVATLANAAARTLHGVEAARQGSGLGMLAGIAGAVAGGAGAVAGAASGGLQKAAAGLSTWAGRVSQGLHAADAAKHGDVVGAVGMGASLATAFTGAKADKVLEKVANGAARARGAEQAIRNHDYLGAASTLAGLAAEVTDGKAKEQLTAWSGRLAEVGQAYRAAAGGDFLGAASTLSRLVDETAWDPGTKLDLGKAADVFARARGIAEAIRSKDYAGAAALAAEVGVVLARGSKGQQQWGRVAETLRDLAPLPGLIARGDYAGAAAILTRIVQERQKVLGQPRPERPLAPVSAKDVARMAGEIEAALAAGDLAKVDALLAAAAGAAAPSAPAGTTPYTVVSGDTLSEIAKRAGVPLAEILKLNPEITDPNRIFVGQSIRLPAGLTLGPSAAPKPPSPATAGGTAAPTTDVGRAVDEVIGLLDDWTRGPEERRILEIIRALPDSRMQDFLDELGRRGYLEKLFGDVHGANYQELLRVLEEKGGRAGLDETLLGQVLGGIFGGAADFGTGFVEGIAALFKARTWVGLADLGKTLFLAADPYGVVRVFFPTAHREALEKLKQMALSIRDQMAADWRAAKAQGKEAEIIARWSTQGVLEVASFFVGAGEVKAALNTTRLGAKLLVVVDRVMGLVSRVGGWDRVGRVLRRSHPERADEILAALKKYGDTGDEAALAKLSGDDLDELARALDADLAAPRIGAGRALVLDDAAEEYARLVNSNQKNWSWLDDITGGANLTDAEKAAVKQRAVQLGLIPDVPYKPGTRFPDFQAAGLVRRAEPLPEWLWKATDQAQFDWLDAKIGGRPPGMTWHHSEIPGQMELVPFGIHNVTNHSGGRAPGMWAHAPRR
jgi:hypothetical protein